MKNLLRIHPLILGALFVSLAVSPGETAGAPGRPSIYDTKADGAKQIADALVTAKADHKNVILQFGANWCGWCHKLHKLFQTDKDIAAVLQTNYIVVLIDVDTVDGKPHNADTNAKYGNPRRGQSMVMACFGVGC